MDCQVATTGSDAARGTADQPFRTIQRGLDFVARDGGTVTVAPGTYAEELTIGPRPPAARPIVLRSAQPQAAILDGAERVTAWRLLDAQQHIWTRDFGPAAPYHNDRGRWDLAPRSEQVFVNGRRCAPAKEGTPIDTMPDYSFTATSSTPVRYMLKLPADLNPDTARTEITTKATLLKVRSDRAVIEGFVFRRARTTYQQAMVTLSGEAIEFRGNLLEYASAGSGLAIQTKHAHIHDNTLRANGQFGFSLGGTGNVVENNLVTGNDLAGYKEWGTGGTKIVGSNNVIRHNRFIGNLGGVAIWLDSGPYNNVITHNFVSGNYGEGIRAEISFHSLIAFNLVETTQPCTSTMFGRTQTHCIGISVQNSAEIWVVNNLVRDNRATGIQLYTYRRKGTDLPSWQSRTTDEKHAQWLQRSWADQVVHAYGNRFFNNLVVQDTAEAAGPCLYVRGLLNGDAPHCHGNEVDANFYWNSVTHAPQVQLKDGREMPNGQSDWQTRRGLDGHGRGAFGPAAYLQPIQTATYPYEPTAAFLAANPGRDLSDLPWEIKTDYLDRALPSDRRIVIGHIQSTAQ